MISAKLDGDCRYGFRIVGSCAEARWLVVATAAFSAYVACDPLAQIDSEAYLSAFQFGDDFQQRVDAYGRVDVKGFKGDCWSPWLWFDIDRENDINAALSDTRRLAAFMSERYRLDGDEMLIFYSGSKGFHVGVPTSLFNAAASAQFNGVCKRVAEAIASQANIIIDRGVYDKVRPFRAPNSRHPKTGRHKRRLAYDELLGLSIEAVIRLSENPSEFEVPDMPPVNDQAVADWIDSAQAMTRVAVTKSERQSDGTGLHLNKLTRRLIANIEMIAAGDRHRFLFSAAVNLGDFDCPAALAHALLTDAGLDSGLSPTDVARQIECGLKHNKS